jgi:hypothetical protein
MSWMAPGYNYGYTITRIDEHPWNTLITMKEVLRLDPGSLVFTGPDSERHTAFWKDELPQFASSGVKPVFELDCTLIHPHRVESEPRQPFEPWKPEGEPVSPWKPR